MVTANFSRDEIACPCCGAVIYNENFIKKIQILRDLLGIPFIIREGGFYRCTFYNSTLKNASPTSKHKRGIAIDISMHGWTNSQCWKLVKFAMDMRLSVGLYSGHVHLDMREGEPSIFYGIYAATK